MDTRAALFGVAAGFAAAIGIYALIPRRSARQSRRSANTAVDPRTASCAVDVDGSPSGDRDAESSSKPLRAYALPRELRRASPKCNEAEVPPPLSSVAQCPIRLPHSAFVAGDGRIGDVARVWRSEVNGQRYILTTQRTALDMRAVYAELATSYWRGRRRVFDDVYSAWANSFQVLAMFRVSADDDMAAEADALARGRPVAFARIVGDGTSFAYLSDVWVAREERGRGLAKWMMTVIVERLPETNRISNFLLATGDAQSLYSRYGWFQISEPHEALNGGRGAASEGGLDNHRLTWMNRYGSTPFPL